MAGKFSRTALLTGKTREQYLQTFEEKRFSTQNPLPHPRINHVTEENEDIFSHTSSQHFPFLRLLPRKPLEVAFHQNEAVTQEGVRKKGGLPQGRGNRKPLDRSGT